MKPSANYAILGNQPDTPLPIVDPETGKEVPLYDKRRLAGFAEAHSGQYRKMMELVARIHSYTELKLRELADVWQLPENDFEELVRSTRTRLLADTDYLTFLQRFAPEHRDAAFRQYGRIADDYISEMIDTFLSHYGDKLGITNEVKAVNDPARLLLMTFNTGLSPRIRHEAKRKLLLMRLLAQLEHYGASDRDSEEAMSEMTRFVDENILIVPTGKKRGETQTHYIVSDHGKDNEKRTVSANICEHPPARLKANQRITPMAMRQAEVVDHKGKKRTIHFFMDIREKGTYARLNKKLRYDEPIELTDDDHNDMSGIRMVFEQKQDWIDFFNLLEVRLKAAGYNVEILARKDNLDGRTEFDGRSTASSPDLKELKLRLRVSNGRKFVYEFQICLPDGYADYLYRRGVCWEQYNVRRFFEEGVARLLFPPSIYPDIDFEKIKQHKIDEVWRDSWAAGENVVARERIANGNRN